MEEEIKTEVTKSEEDASKETKPEKVEETPDYEALFKEEQERREKAEHKIVKLRAKDLEEEPEEKKDLKSYIDQRVSELKVISQEERFNSEIDKASTNESEKKLIRFHLENNNLTGSVVEQVQKAKALANYKRVVQMQKELTKSLETKPGNEDSSSYKPKPSKTTDLTEKDIEFLKKRGLYDKYLEKYGK